MRKLAILLLPLGIATGCFYPTYYSPAPRYYYVPDAPPVGAVPYETPRTITGSRQPAQPAAPAQPAPAPAAPAQPTREETLRRLQAERDAAQKALDAYTAKYYSRSLAPRPLIQRQPAAPKVMPRVSSPSSTDFGLMVGLRGLDSPIGGNDLLGDIGLSISHQYANSPFAFDLGLGASGFSESGGGFDHFFTSFEASAGFRMLTSDIDYRQKGRRSSFYIGGGVMAIEAVDTVEDSTTGATIAEDVDASTGTYACIGVHYRDNIVSSSDFEVRQVMNTEFSDLGPQTSVDGLEVLLRFSLVF